MSERFEIEHVRRVFDNQHGGHIMVGRDSDGLGLVQISTDAKSSGDFGQTQIAIQPAMARLLGKAIIEAANDIEDEGDGP